MGIFEDEGGSLIVLFCVKRNMKTFVANIFSRLSKFSQKLDNLTLLTNQHWVILDESQNLKTVYIFRSNGELLISINGDVKRAKWEYLGANALLIDLQEKSYLFRHGFFDENILALKIDSKEEYAIFVNESKHSKELNSIDAISAFLNHKYLKSVPVQAIPSSDELCIQKIANTGDVFTLRFGTLTKLLITLSNGRNYEIYKKHSNGKCYFYPKSGDIILFSDELTCFQYLLREARTLMNQRHFLD